MTADQTGEPYAEYGKGFRKTFTFAGPGIEVRCPYIADEVQNHDRITIVVILDSEGCVLRHLEKSGAWTPKEKMKSLHVAVFGSRTPHIVTCPAKAGSFAILVETQLARELIASDPAPAAFADMAQLNTADAMILPSADEFRPFCNGSGGTPCERYYAAQGAVVAGRILKALFLGEPPIDFTDRLPTNSLAKVHAYFLANIAHGYDPVKTLKVAGFSETPFLRRFKGSTGMTPLQYFRECQIRYAKKLVETTDMSVLQIAQASGFKEDSGAMAGWFKKFGFPTPRVIRARLKNDQKAKK